MMHGFKFKIMQQIKYRRFGGGTILEKHIRKRSDRLKMHCIIDLFITKSR
jgi:hypothetical protein